MRLVIRDLGVTDYQPVFDAMRRFTDARTAHTTDELWITQHNPVFTLGQAAAEEHLLNPGEIPVVKADRGGQVTYHGPGQLVAYVLFDINRNKHSVHECVRKLEQSMIDALSAFGIAADRLSGAPGVYCQGKKIGALGLKVRKGCTYHGLALNVDMNLEPFERINPCGLIGMQVTQMVDFVAGATLLDVQRSMEATLVENYGYDATTVCRTTDSWDSAST